MNFRIADTFTASFAKLTSGEQGIAKTTAFNLQAISVRQRLLAIWQAGVGADRGDDGPIINRTDNACCPGACRTMGIVARRVGNLGRFPAAAVDLSIVRQAPRNLPPAGRDTESRALSPAVRFHLRRRVFINGNKTLVFR